MILLVKTEITEQMDEKTIRNLSSTLLIADLANFENKTLKINGTVELSNQEWPTTKRDSAQSVSLSTRSPTVYRL